MEVVHLVKTLLLYSVVMFGTYRLVIIKGEVGFNSIFITLYLVVVICTFSLYIHMVMNMFNKVCKKCGKEWQSKSRNNQYCEDCIIQYVPKEHKSKYRMKDIKQDIELYSYLLGLMYSDGYRDEKKNRTWVMSTDYQIIKDIRDRLQYTGPILEQEDKRGYKTVYRLLFYVDNAKVFAEAGLCNDKTQLELPKDVELYHFLRGLMDGDGHIATSKLLCGTGLNSLQFLGQEKLLLQLQNIIGGSIYKDKRKQVYTLQLNPTNGYILLTKMYENATIKLNRKYEVFKSISNHYLAGSEGRSLAP